LTLISIVVVVVFLVVSGVGIGIVVPCCDKSKGRINVVLPHPCAIEGCGNRFLVSMSTNKTPMSSAGKAGSNRDTIIIQRASAMRGHKVQAARKRRNGNSMAEADDNRPFGKRRAHHSSQNQSRPQWLRRINGFSFAVFTCRLSCSNAVKISN